MCIRDKVRISNIYNFISCTLDLTGLLLVLQDDYDFNLDDDSVNAFLYKVIQGFVN